MLTVYQIGILFIFMLKDGSGVFETIVVFQYKVPKVDGAKISMYPSQLRHNRPHCSCCLALRKVNITCVIRSCPFSLQSSLCCGSASRHLSCAFQLFTLASTVCSVELRNATSQVSWVRKVVNLASSRT